MTWGRMLRMMASCWQNNGGPAGWQMWAADFRGHGESTAEASEDTPLSKQVLVEDTLVSQSVLYASHRGASSVEESDLMIR